MGLACGPWPLVLSVSVVRRGWGNRARSAGATVFQSRGNGLGLGPPMRVPWGLGEWGGGRLFGSCLANWPGGLQKSPRAILRLMGWICYLVPGGAAVLAASQGAQIECVKRTVPVSCSAEFGACRTLRLQTKYVNL